MHSSSETFMWSLLKIKWKSFLHLVYFESIFLNVNFYCALQQGTVKIKRGMMPIDVIYVDDILTSISVIKKPSESKQYKYSNNLYLKMINSMFVRI